MAQESTFRNSLTVQRGISAAVGTLSGRYRDPGKRVAFLPRESSFVNSYLKNRLWKETRSLKDDPISREPIPDQAGPGGDPELSSLNVEQRLAHLRRQFAPGDPVEPTVDADVQPWSLKSLSQNHLVRRSIKSAAALALAGLVVWLPGWILASAKAS